MTATNNDAMLEKIDSAHAAIHRALDMLKEAQAGDKDADLYGFTMHHVESVLTDALVDLKAAGAH